MICYRDMTFCSAFPEKCENDKCQRAFTEEERKKADEWWGDEGEPPIALSDFSNTCVRLEASCDSN
jgi:hypothetical protein